MTSHNEVPPAYVEYFFGTCHGGDFIEFFDGCGARWKRGTPGWHTVETELGTYDFSAEDDLMADADECGVEMMSVLNYTTPGRRRSPATLTRTTGSTTQYGMTQLRRGRRSSVGSLSVIRT